MPNRFTSAFLLVAVLCGPLVAREIYVSPAGNDETGTGTLLLPYATPRKALSKEVVQTGDVVYFRAGVYPGGATVNAANVSIRAFENERAIFRIPPADPVGNTRT